MIGQSVGAMKMTKLEALRRSRLHWYSNWALLVALQNAPKKYMVSGILLNIEDHVVVWHGSVRCALCSLYYYYTMKPCLDCPLKSCLSSESIWRHYAQAFDGRNYPAMIRAAWTLYEELERLYQLELRRFEG